jgi:hypothetical protein
MAIMKKRGAFLYAAALVVSAVVASTSVMSALPAWAVYTTYYSDNTYSTPVGERDIDCSGFHSGWGTTSYFDDGYQDSCHGAGSCGFYMCVNNYPGCGGCTECGYTDCP